ncbi:hypothetical protein CLAFUW4_12158 [Fulvia fulva]|uniref:Uncharacterized protein n=1 Tax=Passalora fulva TaxID=5499 RepID=A0A9Q8PEI7_PASFU|nr:uncharacterized protein CLAFUR5_11196 [Fulvia fulva]KAK4617656.1 hypothetical protein CLAFUR4_12163 [Fulvia fulva]KAK4618608.1 hypothetical protein CLAFUR0_12174 [Fulvia fulva]UJO20989.1 hypothetical protein CLAFUR5_11196 [Fulvia fulva]WPV17808.1 hypothetical protein CLAFUW4_12158 [Fulvia fulva]WPV33421.1 hypothetical protein CLAFUW7_12165 [Fulvia fulva]
MATTNGTLPLHGKPHTSMDNSGHGPLRVPGFANVPLDYEIPSEDRFAHGHDEWYQVPGVTIRELAMVAAMNLITDKPDWHIGISDDAIVERWRVEAEAAYPRLVGDEWPREVENRLLLTQKAWEWCLKELRDKADGYEHKQFVRVLDAGSCVCKSDTIVPTSCANELKAQLAPFYDLPLGER